MASTVTRNTTTKITIELPFRSKITIAPSECDPNVVVIKRSGLGTQHIEFTLEEAIEVANQLKQEYGISASKL